LGVSLVLYPANWRERIFLYSFITFVLFLAILSFPILSASTIDSDIISKTGGYIGF
jgi:hypothetical protein